MRIKKFSGEKDLYIINRINFFENVVSEQTVCTIKFDTDKFGQNKTRDVCWCVFE